MDREERRVQEEEEDIQDGPDKPKSFAEAFAFLRPLPRDPETAAGPSLVAPVGAHRASLVVSTRQKGNPVLSFIHNVPWEFADIVPDYLIGKTACALFLSLRYHLLHPEYIYMRVRELRHEYRLRVLLCLSDIEDNLIPLQDVTKVALAHSMTLIVAWSAHEAARYLETFKAYETKPADSIRERVDGDPLAKLTDVLTTVRSVNKADVSSLASLGSLQDLSNASTEAVLLCPGLGERKVHRLLDALQRPFVQNANDEKQHV